MNPFIEISGRKIGEDYLPLIIAEIGINHNGDFSKAMRMIDDAKGAGLEAVKFQCHIVEEEMIPNNIIPSNAKETIWDMMTRCQFTEEQERELKAYTESKGMIYLSTPFSFAAVDRLERLGITAYKIGSGECNNIPLVKYIAEKRKPIILSTGMNTRDEIENTIRIIKHNHCDLAILHCVSAYPTPYNNINIKEVRLMKLLYHNVIGYSDHSFGILPCIIALSLGASIIEKHFTSSIMFDGPDIPISSTPDEFSKLLELSPKIFDILKYNTSDIQNNTKNFAFHSIVALQDIKAQHLFTPQNITTKRPGTGDFKAADMTTLFGMFATRDIKKNEQISFKDVRRFL